MKENNENVSCSRILLESLWMSFRSLKDDARALLFERKAAHNWYLEKGIARNKYKVVQDIEIVFQF